MVFTTLFIVLSLYFFYFFYAYGKWAWQDRKKKHDGYFPHLFSVLSFLFGCLMVYISTLGG